MIRDDYKKWIDNATYEMLLDRWRNAPAGDPIFMNETGAYYQKVMSAKKAELADNGVGASKRIGWE